MTKQRVKAAFISDLHLHPECPEITHRFKQFISWAKVSAETVYILGDFLHAWPGDDALDAWSQDIAATVAQLADADIPCYFMPGNRDFLLGQRFAEFAKWHVLPDPYVIQLNGERVLLSHGDRYCTKDKAHQWFRWFTRRPSFIWGFTRLPLRLRQGGVTKIRAYSQHRHPQSNLSWMDVVDNAVMQSLTNYKATILVHGHTHRPAEHVLGQQCRRFVLSDWDDNPLVLCYYNTYGFEFHKVKEV